MNEVSTPSVEASVPIPLRDALRDPDFWTISWLDSERKRLLSLDIPDDNETAEQHCHRLSAIDCGIRNVWALNDREVLMKAALLAEQEDKITDDLFDDDSSLPLLRSILDDIRRLAVAKN